MSKKANPVSIGLFLIVGTALALAAVLIFSSRSLFHPRVKQILYFDSSLKGLDPGAPVKFRGVTIGSVAEVMIRHNQSTNDFSMPVLISIDKKLAQAKSDELLHIDSQAMLDHLIQRGFRGRLDAESLVTGVLYISFDIVPSAPAPVLHQLKSEYLEVPTLKSDIQQLLDNLAHVDVRGLSDKLNAILTRVDTSLSELNVAAINAGITNLLASANHVVATPDLTNSFTALRQTLCQAGNLITHVDGRVDPLAYSVTTTLADAQKTLADLRVAVGNVSDLLGPDSALRPDLIQALEQVSDAGRGVADLAEFLERNPNALLVGKKRTKEQ
jgi:phospholipid/cholesterol/gamma-HCH transport system substrate-binding protein